ncbi:metallophosphoesterase [Nannocystis pusilla]|uniref:Metallophosphoesterase n=1 Tax=Nannocystis pusilla TaxID=889268 RepID=A0ABS7TT08_9BACT|nr:metallophosphoesterase [Nannocystis pusilla]MBZ5711365.1 metallophosphoesterase [Nannocystis pusilla]
MVVRRTVILPSRGALIVSTDLHGCWDDFVALREHFLAAVTAEPATHWAILGDTVHGPSEEARGRRPELYDYSDMSAEIVAAILELQRAYPGRIHYVLGNHDHGHVGGPRTAKFHADEVAALEQRCTPAQLADLRALFEPALLAVAAPCGVLLAHGSPDDRLQQFDDLDGVRLQPRDNDPYRRHLLATFLGSYGQRDEVTARLLARVSASAVPVSLVIHGHDRDEEGFFAGGQRQACPVIFGAPRTHKRYVFLNLSSRYDSVADLRDGVEIRRVHGP